MNKDIVEHMIDFVEEKEREFQAERLASGSISKSDKNSVVKAIISKLDSEVSDADTEN